jgi:hypothetical protein
MRPRAGQSGVRIVLVARDVIFAEGPEHLWGALTSLFSGFRGTLVLGVKWSGREADLSPPSNAEVKNEWNYTTAPSVCI